MLIVNLLLGPVVPRTQQGREWECILSVPVPGRENHSFQEWVVRQPIRLGGFGLRSMDDTAGLAFIGALEQSIPSFPGEGGVCTLLEESMGGEDCFGEGAAPETRWRVLIQSGAREGEELIRVWSQLKEEAEEAATWLGE